ncbi:MAG: MFS transporter [Chloroflexota bacterium]
MNRYLTLLRENSNYRNLWLASVISQLGDWFNLIASASLIATLTSSGAAISYLFLARFVPLFFFSPFAGVIADRFNRRHIMIATDVLRALAVLGFLLVRDPSHVWLFYLLTISQFALSSIFTPARTAVLANVVKPEELVTANALDSFTWSTMLAVGSLLGGVAAAAFGLQAAFIMDAATFLLAGWFASRIVLPARRPLEGQPVIVRRGGWFEFVDGLRYLRSEPFILTITLVKAGGSLVWGAINVLEVNYAEDIFPLTQGGSITLGIIYAISGLGTGVGPLLLREWLGDAAGRLRWGISLGFVLLTAGILGLGLAPTLSWFGLATLVRTVGSGTVWVFSAAMLQMIVPDRVRGRVFAFEFAILTLTQSLSTFWAGFAQDTLFFSVRQVTIGMAIAGVVVTLLWFVFHLRTLSHPLRSAPAPQPQQQSRHII